MTTEQIIFVSAQGWMQLDRGQAREIQPWPRLEGPALVVVDFVDALVGVQYCKGKRAYAAAQIEKQVRAEGLIDGAVQVLIHRQVGHADSNQSLYTAVPLAQWQELQSWAMRQRDHCLILPLAGLLAAGGAGEDPVILRSGSQLHVYGEQDGRLHYASAAALGQDPFDFVVPVRAALTQFRSGGWKGAARQCRWAVAQPGEESREQALIAALSEAGVVQAAPLPLTPLADASGTTVVSALPGLLARVPAWAWTVPVVQRLAWFAERHVQAVVAMVAVIAAGLGVVSFFADRAARAEQSIVAELKTDVEGLRERVAKAQGDRTPVSEAPEFAFARQLGFAMSHDPVRMLGVLRHVAGEQIRIQRVQLNKGMPPTPARFRVDGVAEEGAAEALSHFLAALRAEGWEAESTAPGDSAAGAFAYYLRAVPAASR